MQRSRHRVNSISRRPRCRRRMQTLTCEHDESGCAPASRRGSNQVLRPSPRSGRDLASEDDRCTRRVPRHEVAALIGNEASMDEHHGKTTNDDSLHARVPDADGREEPDRRSSTKNACDDSRQARSVHDAGTARRRRDQPHAELARRCALRQLVTIELPLRKEDAIHSKARAVGITVLIGSVAVAESTVSPEQATTPVRVRDESCWSSGITGRSAFFIPTFDASTYSRPDSAAPSEAAYPQVTEPTRSTRM
jgi:hypothetical protein